MTADSFVRMANDNPTAPGRGSRPVTPNDAADLPTLALSLYVTVGGDVRFEGVDGVEDTWTVPDNYLIPIAMRKVWADGTTATGIKAIV